MAVLFIIGFVFIVLGIYVTIKSSKKLKEGIPLILFGMVWWGIAGVLLFASTSETNGQLVMKIFLFIMGLVFATVGGNICFVKPLRRKKDMVDCYTIRGTQVDYTTSYSRKGRKLYKPIYSYYYNGEEKRLSGSISSNAAKYREIGRMVTIVINNKTGDVYCTEDASSERRLGAVFFLAGLGVLALFAYIINIGAIDNKNDGYNENGNTHKETGVIEGTSTYDLNLDSEGYSN